MAVPTHPIPARSDQVNAVRPPRWAALLIAAAMVLGALLAAFVGPGQSDPGPWRGDADVAARAERALAGEPGVTSAETVVLDPAGERRATLGAPGHHHELGSITKTFNGLLLADAVERREMALTDRLGTHLPELAGSPVGDVTLGELAQHRGGVQELLPAESLRGLVTNLTHGNPYHLTTAQVVEQSREIKITMRGERRYSNLGAALLGHALARAAHQPDWPTLVRTRLWQPLGMNDTLVATRPDLVPADASPVRTANGVTAEHWSGEGMAPAGTSTYTTIDDLTRYARALLDGRAPGMQSLDPTFEASPRLSVGLAWLTSKLDQGTVTWHNGGTGGSRTHLALDRQNNRAVVVLNDSAVSVDDFARTMLLDAPVKKSGFPIIAVAVLVIAAVMVAQWAWRLWRSAGRIALVDTALETAVFLWLAHVLGPWDRAPGAVWGLLAGAAVGCLLVTALTWRTRTWTGRKRVTELVSLAIAVIFAVVVGAAALAG